MAISDVGIAYKNNVFEALSVETLGFMRSSFAQHTHQDGVFFHATNLEWSGSKVSTLSGELDGFSDNDFLVVVGRHDDPDNGDQDRGNWTSNPFSVFKETYVSINFTTSRTTLHTNRST